MEEETPTVVTPTDKTTRIVDGFIVGAIVATFFVVFLTIVGEFYKPLKDLLKEQHSHHWVGKGIWSTVTFFVVGIGYYYFLFRKGAKTVQLINILSWTLISSLIVLLLFFTYEFYGHI